MKLDESKLCEQYLIEATRGRLIDKSRNADKTKSYGTTRWDRRRKIQIYPTVANYNKVDMNALFHGDLMNFIIPVHGDREAEAKDGREHQDYSVEILFEKVLEKLQTELKNNNYKLEFKIVYRALVNAINTSDIMVACTCKDWFFTHGFQATHGQYNAGAPELIPAPITNPNDTKGAGCKHIMNVLGNLDWCMKLAASINNYIFYMKDHFPDKFASVIWPAISGMEYQDAYQQGLFDDLANTMVDEPNTNDVNEIDAANEEGKTRGRFKKKENDEVVEPEEEEEPEADGQLSLFDDEESEVPEEETVEEEG